MGIETIYIDDLTGERVDPDTEVTAVTMDGQDYDIYLGAESKETMIAFLEGDAPLLKPLEDARTTRQTMKSQLDAVTARNNEIRGIVDILVSNYTGDEEAPEVIKEFIKDYRALGTSSSTAPAAAKSAASGSARGRKPVDTYGFDFKEVRDYAISEGLTAISGKPITESTRVLNQSIYNTYRDAQTSSK